MSAAFDIGFEHPRHDGAVLHDTLSVSSSGSALDVLCACADELGLSYEVDLHAVLGRWLIELDLILGPIVELRIGGMWVRPNLSLDCICGSAVQGIRVIDSSLIGGDPDF